MATYIVGDIQGCFRELQLLLEQVKFDKNTDRLWSVGDLVNRGPDSLAVLRFFAELPHSLVTLGNHDLHLLAVANGFRPYKPNVDTFTDILEAPDRSDLIKWLTAQPLLHSADDVTLVHAGISPLWDLDTAQACANEISALITSAQAADFYENMYGNEPALWQPELTGNARYRCITNILTRMRYCHDDGSLALQHKSEPEPMPSELHPWFALANQLHGQTIIFGHWAALNGQTNSPQFIGLDTGCVWGNQLTMMCLESRQYYSVNALTKNP